MKFHKDQYNFRNIITLKLWKAGITSVFRYFIEGPKQANKPTIELSFWQKVNLNTRSSPVKKLKHQGSSSIVDVSIPAVRKGIYDTCFWIKKSTLA